MNCSRNVGLLLSVYTKSVPKISKRVLSFNTVITDAAELCYRNGRICRRFFRKNDASSKTGSSNENGQNFTNTMIGGKQTMLIALSVTGVLQYFRATQDKDDNDSFEELKKCQRYIEDGNIITAENILKHKLAHTKDDHVTIKSKELLSDIATERRQYDKAEKLIRENLEEMSKRGFDSDNPKFIRLQLKLAKILEHRYRDRDAESIYRLYVDDLPSRIALAKELNNEDALTLWLEFTVQYSDYRYKTGYSNEALDYLRRSYDICLHLYGEDGQQLVRVLSGLGKISFTMNDFDQSAKYLQKAYEIGKRYPDTKELSVVYTYLGNLSLKRGLLAEAKNYCDIGLDYATRHMVSDYISDASLCVMNVTNAMQ